MKVILMHGKDTDPSQIWYPWLADIVRGGGQQFIAPILSRADDPEIGEWVAQLHSTEPDKDSILVGHSRGGVAILRWLEQQPKGRRIKKVILIATNSGNSEKMSKTANNRGFFTKAGYDFDKIKTHCDDFVMLHSKDDKWVPFNSGEENAEGLNARFLQFNNRGHFGRGVDEIPELLEEIIKSK